MKIKAKDLKVGDLFKDPSDGALSEVVNVEPAVRVTYKFNASYAPIRPCFEPDEEVELVEPPKPEVYTVADIKVGDLVEIEKGSITGIFEVTGVEDKMTPCIVLHLRNASIVPVVLSVSVLWPKYTKIKKPEPPAIAPWIIESI